MSKQENERMMLYPLHLILFLNIELNSLYKWQCIWDWLCKGCIIQFNKWLVMDIIYYPFYLITSSNYQLFLQRRLLRIWILLHQSTRMKSYIFPNNVSPPVRHVTQLTPYFLTQILIFYTLGTCAADSMSPFMQDFVPGTFVIIDDPLDVKGSRGDLPMKGYGTV